MWILWRCVLILFFCLFSEWFECVERGECCGDGGVVQALDLWFDCTSCPGMVL